MQNCRFRFVFTFMFVAASGVVGRGAIVQNGSFEDGLTGWTVIGGSATTAGNIFGIGPTEGASQASINNAGAVATDSAIETALNLVTGRLDDLAGGSAPQAVNGTAIYQLITNVLAGEQLSFDWSFVTDENVAAGFPNQNDFAFWSISDVANPGTVLHRAADPLQAASGTFDFKSAPGRVTYTFTASGDYLLAFGVMNVFDGGGASGLLIDNVAVPEPTSLGLLGLVSCGWLIHRRRR